MDHIERILSRPVAKPYRNAGIELGPPDVNENGHVSFGPGDIENPKNWSVARRWYITVVSIMLVVNATFASSSPSGCINVSYNYRIVSLTFLSIAESFHVSVEAAGLVTTLFLLGYCVLADIWGPVERGNAMALFAMMTFAGPALGPVVAGFLELKKDWRWDFYVLLWLAGGTAILMFTIPETLPSIVLQNKARRIRKAKIPGYETVKAPVEDTNRSLMKIYKVALTRPWIILFDPISFLIALYISVVYTLLYMLFTIYPIVFQEKRGWNSGVGELPLIGTVIGAMLGGIVIFVNSARDQRKIDRGHQSRPEDRLPVAMAGSVGFAITMFWFAWSAEYNSVHWIVPTIAGVFLATSIMLIFVAFLNYLTDAYLMYAASAIAANTVARSAAGASAPLFTTYMFDSLGVGGGGSLIGGMAAVLAIIPFAFYRYGEPIRKRSKFAPTSDKRPDEKADEDAQGGPVPRRNSQASTLSDSLGSSSNPSNNYIRDEEKEDDVRQDTLGEPRDQNVRFGREDV
ncbi:putative benomyl methotrexate resistance protein [Phaeomoniella chlamydospora]|uniref:Putative benomyl methotrexate resistance protein n=1 Tax=Phaeomoniella chlamydospora TaxID=158046 RepID=A0A0G2DTU4_PHACM|nr:putative benomyl methotrexate resistance protein [Phaeomoniella chlamydospora]